MTDVLDAANKAAANRPEADTKKCILVLGMHRSGTSATTRVLSLLGAALPKRIMGASLGNETGHWEPAALVAAHDRMLAEVGSRWDDWRKLDLGRMQPTRRAEMRTELAALIEEEYGQAPLAVLKDPRVCRFVPLYAELLASRAAEPCCVIPLRNPLAVIASLKARDSMSEAFAGLLWLRHVLDAEAATREWPRAIVSYEDMVTDWQPVLGRMAARLGFLWPVCSDVAAEISAFLSAVHQHHAASRHELADRGDVADWVKAAYDALSCLEQDPDNGTALSRLDRIRSEFDAACPVLGTATFAELAAREGRFSAERQRLTAKAEERISSLEATLLEVKEQNGELRSYLSDVENELAEAQGRAKELSTTLEARARQLTEEWNKVATLEKLVHEERQQAVDARHKLAALEQLLPAPDHRSQRLDKAARKQTGPIRLHASPSCVRLMAALRHPMSSRKRKNFRAKQMLIMPSAGPSLGRHSKSIMSFPTLIRERLYRAKEEQRAGPRLHCREPQHLPSNNSASSTTNVFTNAQREALVSAGWFDEHWYRNSYPTVPKGCDALEHYATKGVLLGYDPSEHFNTLRYLDVYRDVKASGQNPLWHYITHGIKEGRTPKPHRPAPVPALTRMADHETGTPSSILKYDEPTQLNRDFKLKTCVHLHLYHTDLADELAMALSRLPAKFTLLLSLPGSENVDQWTDYFSKRVKLAETVIAKAAPNRGRDVAPWLILFRDEILASDLFCHIHSKKSNHNLGHRDWRRYLIHCLFGSNEVATQVLNLFHTNSSIGVLAPCYHWSLANQPNWGKNIEQCRALYSRLGGGDFPAACPDYPAGSFFWARVATLKPLFDLELRMSDFPTEASQLDGTLAHAIERLIGLLPRLTDTSYHRVTVDVAYNLTRYVNRERTAFSPACVKRNTPAAPAITRTSSFRVAMFSCIAGSYEEAMPPTPPSNGCEQYLFTDAEIASPPPGVTIVGSPYIHPQPVRTARFVKTHPHVWFPDHDFVCWIDSNVHFLGDLRQYIDLLTGRGSDIGFIQHPVRDTVAEESRKLIELGIVDPNLAGLQAASYAEERATLCFPLFETNFFICRPRSPRVKELMQIWWAEISRFTHRDQLSIGFATRKSGARWTPLLAPGWSTRDHHDFLHFSHDYKGRDDVIAEFRGSAAGGSPRA